MTFSEELRNGTGTKDRDQNVKRIRIQLNFHLIPPNTTSGAHDNTGGTHNKSQVGPTQAQIEPTSNTSEIHTTISGAHSNLQVGPTNNHK